MERVIKLWNISPFTNNILVCRVGGCLIPHRTRTAEDRTANSLPQPPGRASKPP